MKKIRADNHENVQEKQSKFTYIQWRRQDFVTGGK